MHHKWIYRFKYESFNDFMIEYGKDGTLSINNKLEFFIFNSLTGKYEKTTREYLAKNHLYDEIEMIHHEYDVFTKTDYLFFKFKERRPEIIETTKEEIYRNYAKGLVAGLITGVLLSGLFDWLF